MSGSAVPACLTALVSVWSDVSQSGWPAPVRIVDGVPYDVPANFLAVGWVRADQPAVAFTNRPRDAGGVRGMEEFDVRSLLSVSFDDDEVAVARGRLFDAYQVFADALAADPRLGGAVMRAWTIEGSLTQILTESGAVLDLEFSTRIQASK